MSMITLAFIPTPGPMEMIIIAAVGLIIFGNRLPEVGRSLGKSITEFKKGIKGVKNEINKAEEQQVSTEPSEASTMEPDTTDTTDYTPQD